MDEFARFKVADKLWLGFEVIFATPCGSWWLSVDLIVATK